ncbi:MAG TPA: dioxygenase [Candidatus Acidoferrales bacterium]|jgi:protocatechuate 3,4-dioxygenase beta subunit|nr:dioxygenase [Candidatus Acidoferrales bacterium]
MRTLDENTITDAVLEQISRTPDPRFKQIMEAAVRHLHAFAREVNLTPQEWLEGIRFFTEVGQKCTPYRQEFILLSDTLGLSALVGLMSDKNTPDIHTDTSLLGPFYRQNSPHFKLGDSIAKKTKGKEIVLWGQIRDANGPGIPNASIEVWQTDEVGDYDMQRPDVQVEMDLRGTLQADSEGRYYFRSVVPAGYSIPMDGPVGEMIRAQKRHGLRPSHIHYLIGAPGHKELVTALYVHGDPNIDSDTVFGVTDSLVVKVTDPDPSSPFPKLPGIKYDFTLAAAGKDDASGRVGADPSQITKNIASVH